MYSRYEGFINDEISTKMKACQSLDDWIAESEDVTQADERVKICAANALNVYGEQALMEICYTIQVLFKMRQADLLNMCRDLRIIIHPKVLKRESPVHQIVSKIMSQYTKPKISSRLKSFASYSILEVFPAFNNKDISSQEKLDLLMEQTLDMYKPTDDEERLNYRTHAVMCGIACNAWIIDDVEFNRYALDRFDEEHWRIYDIGTYNAYRLVFQANTKSNILNIEDVLAEKKSLEKQFNSQIKKQEHLNMQLQQTTEEKNKLKGKIVELNQTAESQLADAISEISKLQTYIEKIESEKNEEIGLLKNEIIHLTDQLSGKSDKPLDGFTVCVVGIPQDEQFFEQTIIKYGGKFEFFPSVTDSVSPRLMSGPVNRSDVVLYCHTYTSHSVRDTLRSVAGNKIEYLESNGKSSFEHLLLTRIIPKLRQTTLVR